MKAVLSMAALAEGEMVACRVDGARRGRSGTGPSSRNGEGCGWLTSGGFGHTVGKPFGFGYVRNKDGVDRAFLETGRYDLEIAGELTPCTIHLQPLL